MYNFNANMKRLDWLHSQFADAGCASRDEFHAAVNEAYYAASAHLYGERYVSDIEQVYDRLFQAVHLERQTNWTIVNIGGGTGFEFEQFLRNRIDYARYLFIEPHAAMAEQFSNSAGAADRRVEVRLGRFEDFAAALGEVRSKILIMNSCLHHIVEVKQFLDAVKGCMRGGDLLVIGHEPNNNYFRTPQFALNVVVRALVTDLIPRKLGLWKTRRSEDDGERWDAINSRLRGRHITVRRIPALGLRRLVDYGVNAQGDWARLKVPLDHDEGYWMAADLGSYLGQEYEVAFHETYRHFGDASGNLVVDAMNRFASAIRMGGGSVFTIALRKLG